MQLANLKTFESGVFEMPKCRGLSNLDMLLNQRQAGF